MNLKAKNSRLYQQHVKLLWSVVHRVHAITGCDINDLFSVGEEMFMRAAGSYKPSHGPFAPYFSRLARNGMIDHVRRCKTSQMLDVDMVVIGVAPRHLWRLELIDFANGLSTEALEVIQLILTAPADLLGIEAKVIRPKLARGKIRDLLRGQGWTFGKVAAAFIEIRTALERGQT